MEKERSYIDLVGLAKSYMASRIFLTAFELGIFEGLGERRLSASELAAVIDSDLRATEILLDALTGMGLLQKDGNAYMNLKGLGEILVPGNALYQGGTFGHFNNLWEPWSHLTEAVKKGAPHERDWNVEMCRDLATAMKQQGASIARRLSMLLEFSGIRRMLDLGSGAGSCTIALVHRYPLLRAVLFDSEEEALDIARQDIATMELEDRITVRKGNFLVDAIGSGYDVALVSSVISLFGQHDISTLLRKVRECLRPGGHVVICDLITDESRTRPMIAAIFAVNMLVNTRKGRVYSFTEIDHFLKLSGFREIRNIPGDNLQMVMGCK